jgi:hypothetical protein
MACTNSLNNYQEPDTQRILEQLKLLLMSLYYHTMNDRTFLKRLAVQLKGRVTNSRLGMHQASEKSF